MHYFTSDEIDFLSNKAAVCERKRCVCNTSIERENEANEVREEKASRVRSCASWQASCSVRLIPSEVVAEMSPLGGFGKLRLP